MGLSVNHDAARKADNIGGMIRESGRYVGTITRAEALVSKNGVQGLGLSFKNDNGQSASYLDIYTVKKNGEMLRGFDLVQAILVCLGLKAADDGEIHFDRWDNDERKLVPAKASGYPALMGKKIGLLLQMELQTNPNTGSDTERLNIVVAFQAATGLTASEILDGKTKPEKVDVLTKMVMANPIRDRREKKRPAATRSATGVATNPSGDPGFSDDDLVDIPY